MYHVTHRPCATHDEQAHCSKFCFREHTIGDTSAIPVGPVMAPKWVPEFGPLGQKLTPKRVPKIAPFLGPKTGPLFLPYLIFNRDPILGAKNWLHFGTQNWPPFFSFFLESGDTFRDQKLAFLWSPKVAPMAGTKN